MPAPALYGAQTWVDALLAAVQAQLARVTGLGGDRVFESLCTDEEHLAFPPADRFLTLSGLRFPVGEGVPGGGRDNTGFDGRLRAALFARVASDQELRSTRLLRDASQGVLALQLKVLDALQMFAPRPEGGDRLVREPMRITEWGVLPKGLRSGSSWAVLESFWEVKFTARLASNVP